MLNEVTLMGRLTRDPVTSYMQNSNSSVTRFTLAVEKDFKAANEEKPKTNFISCEAWNQKGDFITKYFRQGSMICVKGSIETGSYTDRNGNKVNKKFTGFEAKCFCHESDHLDGILYIDKATKMFKDRNEYGEYEKKKETK